MRRKSDRKRNTLVCVVGPESSRNRRLITFLKENKPEGREHIWIRERNELPTDLSETDVLILFDCRDMDDPLIDSRLCDIMSAHSLRECRICLFNLSRENGKEKDFLRLGIRGVFYRDMPYEIIRKSIPAVLKGELWYPRDILAACALENYSRTFISGKEVGALTRREKEILQKIASGASNRDISRDLFISPHTVKTHVYRIFRKIGAKNRVEASLWARENPAVFSDSRAFKDLEFKKSGKGGRG